MQNSSQVMINNQLRRSSINQMDVQLTSITSCNSTVRQRSVQNATGNALINTALNQMVNEPAVIIGNSTVSESDLGTEGPQHHCG